MPNSCVTNQLSSLPHLHKPALSELWRQLFKTDPPLRMRKELMLQFVAYRMQEREFGALSNSNHRRLIELRQPFRDRSPDHRYAVVGTALLRPE